MLYALVASLNKDLKKLFRSVSKIQQEMNIGGGERKISGKSYFSLRVTISSATLHHNLIHNFTMMLQFEEEYNTNNGFGMTFDVTNSCSLVHHSMEHVPIIVCFVPRHPFPIFIMYS